MPTHLLNWYLGWWLVLAAFGVGAGLGLFCHEEGFLGGYGSFRRRMLRLGHIALAALGMLNVIFSFSPWPQTGAPLGEAASVCFLIGGLVMPTVCFLTAWRDRFRHLFFVPVLALMAAVGLTLCGRNGPTVGPNVSPETARPAGVQWQSGGQS